MNEAKLNPLFQQLTVDYLYHLGFDSAMDLQAMFGEVKYVILTRSFNNADMIANEFASKFYKINNIKIKCATIGKDERYHIHKVHNTLIVSHGIGAPSLLICLNEIAKLLWHSKAQGVKFFRISPSGGLGVPIGSIVLGSEAVNNALKATIINIEFGEPHTYSTKFDMEFTEMVRASAIDSTPIIGKIIGGLGYYTGQARMNGAMPLTFTVEEQQAYLEKAYQEGVRSFDMESSAFAAFCRELNIPTCEVNVTINNRFESDLISLPKKEQLVMLKKAIHLVVEYILGSEK